MSEETNNEKPGFWKRFWFIVRVLEVRLRFILVLVITGALIGYWDVVKNYYDKYTRPGTEQKSIAASIYEFFCPMHPFVVREDFGKCPICGMDLVKREKGVEEELPDNVVARVQISPLRVTEAGVTIEPVQLLALSHTIRSVGAVEANEQKESTIAARFPGRVEELLVNFVGAQVKKGQPVARMYSAKYLAATYEYLQALQSAEGATGAASGRGQALAEAARQRLLLAGFTEAQMDEIRKSGKADPYITYYSPQTGTVMSRNVAEGDYVEEGESLLSIADLSTVWVQVQVLESDLSSIRVQQPVEIRLVSAPGVVYFGNVNFIYPKVDPATRTVNVRVEVQNTGQALRPGMYVTAQVKAPVGGFEPLEPPDTRFLMAGLENDASAAGNTSASIYALGDVAHIGKAISPDSKWEEGYTCVMHPDILQETGGLCNLCNCGMQLTKWRREKVPAVPERAVIDTGLRKFVYVESSDGIYDAHEVILGRRTQENMYPVLAGIETGAQVATFGSFLIDAENRLSAADEIYRAVRAEAVPEEPTVVVDGTYKPDSIDLDKDDPRQITFDRRDEGACTDQVVFPTLGITVDLVPNQKTVVDLPTTASGKIPFSCGMDMLHGTVTLPAVDTSAISARQKPTVVVDGGYKPDNLILDAGDPRQIIFDRRDEGACTDQVKFPTFGITVDLPPGQKTVVDLPTTATGVIPYSCGMDMLHGTITIPTDATQTMAVEDAQSTVGENASASSEEATPTVIVDGGYEPEKLVIEKGSPHQVTFDRRDSGPCTDQVIFPTLGIQVDLPANQKTVVDLPTTASGMITYTCGMEMLHGSIIFSSATPGAEAANTTTTKAAKITSITQGANQ